MDRDNHIFVLCVTDCVYGFQLTRVLSTLERGLACYAHQKKGQIRRRKGVVVSECYRDGLPHCVLRRVSKGDFIILSLHRVALDQEESILGI